MLGLTTVATATLLPAWLPDPDDWPHLPGYEIRAILRSGSRAVVYRAWHSGLDRPVALQVIWPEWLVEPGGVRRYRRAARAASWLTHPHLAPILEVGQAGSADFLVTEDGGDLDSLVRGGGPLPWPDALACARQAALGLAHAHAHNLIHGDMRPAHLLLTGPETGEAAATAGAPLDLRTHSVKLTGFGLAWLTGPDGQSGLRPAQRPGVASRADLYGLGGTLYYLLTGQVPRSDGRDDAPLLLRRVRPDVPPAVAAVVHRLLARRPTDAFQSAAHAAATLGLFTQAPRPVAVSSAGEPPVCEPRPAAGPLVRCLRGAADAITGLACTADGRRLAAASRTRIVHIWDLESGLPLSCQTAPLDRILALSFTADGSLHVAGTRGAGLRCWNADQATVIGRLAAPRWAGGSPEPVGRRPAAFGRGRRPVAPPLGNRPAPAETMHRRPGRRASLGTDPGAGLRRGWSAGPVRQRRPHGAALGPGHRP